MKKLKKITFTCSNHWGIFYETIEGATVEEAKKELQKDFCGSNKHIIGIYNIQ